MKQAAWRALVLALITVTGIALMGFTLTGCGRRADTVQPVEPTKGPSQAALQFAGWMRERVTTDNLYAHLTQLQNIANANKGTRAVGTPGFESSIDYVVGVLRGRGFDVQTTPFLARVFKDGPVTLTVGGAPVTAKAMEYSVATRGVSGPLVAAPVEESPGCAASDYDRLPVAGAVVLVDRGVCPFSVKEAIAAQRGAVGLIVADNVDEQRMAATLGQNTEVKIPVVGVSKADGARLRSKPGRVTLKVDASTEVSKARNVIAQTKTGSANNVVMLGAHLDSVDEGPGINDNGSGVAAVLETAVQLGSRPNILNAVRFAFWGAEELGTVGSQTYVASLNVDQLKDIALYLNFDMLGSPNPGYFTYDGDQSIPPRKDETQARVNEGSAGIERTLVTYLGDSGKIAQDTAFDGRSDYEAFTEAGVPAGGLFSGAEENKTVDQAKLWGGTPDAPFDPNYHKPTDTLDRIDRTALGINGGGAAYAAALYAQDLTGRNGIPRREDRVRHDFTLQ